MIRRSVRAAVVDIVFPPLNPDGTLTRAGAMLAAREKYGDMGTISSFDGQPHMVWCIGYFGATVGRGSSWEEALKNSRKLRIVEVPRETVNKESA